MTVYTVLAWYNYYPDVDNVKGAFLSEKDAQEFLEKFKAEHSYPYDNYDIRILEVN